MGGIVATTVATNSSGCRQQGFGVDGSAPRYNALQIVGLVTGVYAGEPHASAFHVTKPFSIGLVT